jgi:hypothetical protein
MTDYDLHGAPQPPRQGRAVLLGVGLALLLHLLQLPLAYGLAHLGLSIETALGVFTNLSPLFIGVTQLVYLVPAILIARAKGKRGLAKGLLIGGALTLLLNGLCYGYFFFGFGGRIAG